MFGIVAEATGAVWWTYLIVLLGFGLGMWPPASRWLNRAALILSGSIGGIILLGLAGPWLIYLVAGRCDSNGGKVATYIWIYGSLAFAGVAALSAGALTARLQKRSVLLSFAVLSAVGVVSTVLLYIVAIYFAFSAEQCLL